MTLFTTEAARANEYGAEYNVETYGNMLYKLAAAQLNNKSDAYDVLQDVMLKIHASPPHWHDEAHLKAWLIRAVVNRSRDYNKSFWNRNTVPLDFCESFGLSRSDPDFELQSALAALPEKYRLPLYLHYYEGYKISEIAEILRVGESGVKKRLVKGRDMLKAFL